MVTLESAQWESLLALSLTPSAPSLCVCIALLCVGFVFLPMLQPTSLLLLLSLLNLARTCIEFLCYLFLLRIFVFFVLDVSVCVFVVSCSAFVTSPKTRLPSTSLQPSLRASLRASLMGFSFVRHSATSNWKCRSEETSFWWSHRLTKSISVPSDLIKICLAN